MLCVRSIDSKITEKVDSRSSTSVEFFQICNSIIHLCSEKIIYWEEMVKNVNENNKVGLLSVKLLTIVNFPCSFKSSRESVGAIGVFLLYGVSGITLLPLLHPLWQTAETVAERKLLYISLTPPKKLIWLSENVSCCKNTSLHFY